MRLKVVYSVCTPSSGQRSTYIARSASCGPVLSGGNQHASTTLKACLQAICITRPNLVPSSSSDYAVSVLDVLEAERIFEGKGMMGWLLAEEDNPQQPEQSTRVTGRILDESAARGTAGEDAQTLEIVLELVPVSSSQSVTPCLPEE